MSKEKMINFTGDMVRAILEGSKTQTRRPLRKQPDSRHCRIDFENGVLKESSRLCGCWSVNRKWKPSLQPGDTMLVRERTRCIEYFDGKYPRRAMFKYEADGAKSGYTVVPVRLKRIKIGHCVPNGCFRELVRIKRKVVRVWYERVQDISTEDAMAEGVDDMEAMHTCAPASIAYIGVFSELWEKIYPGSWDRNDWVECIEFEGK